MGMFVFRNNTVERFFPEDCRFSGYDDISEIPPDADGYVWFHQAPIDRASSGDAARGVRECRRKFDFVLGRIDPSKTLVALTMDVFFPLSFTEDDHALQQAVAEYNLALFGAEKTHGNLKVLDFSDFTRRHPAESLVDWKFHFISHLGLNPRLTADFQAWWARKMEGIALKRKKCIVLDLDNTLWGGVLGEDGCSGIQIGGDYPGKVFLFFQRALLQLAKTGVILAVCSKNNERDVLEAWENNPFMVLKKEHFAAWRINWTDKASNLRELAAELNIGLDSFVFVDDNPIERELVRKSLPMVAVPDFPAQPYRIPAFFKKLADDCFKVYSVTDEDRKKTEQYRANAARAQARQSFAGMEDFLKSLDMQVTVEAANPFNIPRIAQMTQKTNQFNLTTRRYTETDIRNLLENGWKIWCAGVADKFGDNGITGCILIDGDRIDTFLLSCRILGRGIEFAFLKTVLSLVKENGCRRLAAAYIPTPKNAQVRDFYERAGFSLVSETDGRKEYVLDLDEADLRIKDGYRIVLK